MSIINKMLQELDRRHAQSGAPGQPRHPDVRAIPVVRSGHEWFWRIVAGLMLVAAGWTAWVVFQLQPRSLVTELALRVVEGSDTSSAVAPAEKVVAVAPAPAETASTSAAPTVAAPAPVPAPERLAAPIETLRLALTIDTPFSPRPQRVAQKEEPPPPRTVATAPKPRAEPPKSDSPRAHIEKRARELPPVELAEAEFRRAARLLERGRVADAEDALRSALDADPAHRAARQTLIALHLDQGRIDEARRDLQEGLAINPGYAPYAVALARIYVDRGEGALALATLESARGDGQGNADYHAMHGAVLLRLGRHDEAADAYRAALKVGAQTGTSWVGLGVALDSAGRRPEAAEAFRRGIATGTLTEDLRRYAEQRARQLQ